MSLNNEKYILNVAGLKKIGLAVWPNETFSQITQITQFSL